MGPMAGGPGRLLGPPGRALSGCLAGISAALLAAGLLSAATAGAAHSTVAAGGPATPVPVVRSAGGDQAGVHPPVAAPVNLRTPVPTTAAPASQVRLAVPRPAIPSGPVPLAGCPPPPIISGPPGPPPAHPAPVVPDADLPIPPAPAPRVADLAAIAGKGMWIWELAATENGNAAAIVARAAAAGLHQIWVRVGDSFDGFYGAGELAALVPAAHRAGLGVIGWGFPYLDDPVGDAAWTTAALDWVGPGGARLDGWAADLETASEGVDLSGRRAATYLGLVRPAARGRPLVATVFPPTGSFATSYPYEAMAPYVDAFAPMDYWGCQQPASAATQSLARLAGLAPVELVGQAYDMADEGGRRAAPSAAEILSFLATARAAGAVGASFWSWQAADAAEWTAVATFPWAAGQPAPRG